ncbi:MAG: glutaredoxin family protein [Deltaproteobacteria bacterium]|nr:glutaredoxin family protein [Deltaproteobacteria bacterium]
MKIEIYTTAYCPFCVSAKKLLQDRGLSFQEIDVSDPKKKEPLKEKTGWRTVPQIFIEDKLIGGFQELSHMDQKGLLKH